MELLKHIQKLKEGIEIMYAELGDLCIETRKADEELRNKSSEYSEEKYSNLYFEQVNAFKEKVAAIQEEFQTMVQETKTAYMTEVRNYYRPDANKIDLDDQAVIATGILNVDEVCDMIVKHSDNPTMLRIIQQYMITNNLNVLDDFDISRCLVCANKDGKVEENIFDTFVSLAGAAFGFVASGGTENTIMLVHSQLDGYVRDAEKRLLLAKPYQDQETKDRINEIIELERQEHNNVSMGKSFLD